MRIGGSDELVQGGGVDAGAWFQLDVAHVFACAFKQMAGVGQFRTAEEAHVDVGREGVDVGEGYVAEAGDGAAVMQQLAHFISACAHHVEPVACHVSQLAGVVFHPRIDGGVVCGCVVELQEVVVVHWLAPVLAYGELYTEGVLSWSRGRRLAFPGSVLSPWPISEGIRQLLYETSCYFPRS